MAIVSKSGSSKTSNQFTQLTHDFVAQEMGKEGIKLLDRYERNAQHMRVLCPNNHEYSITWCLFQGGTRCQKCRWEKHRAQFGEVVRAAFEAEGYTMLSEYVRSDLKIKFRCPAGHIHSISWDKFKDGKRCAKCAGKSKDDADKEILRLKRNIRLKITRNLRSLQKTGAVMGRSELAQTIAVAIQKHLGFLPDGHHLDHIVPRSWFNEGNLDEIKACWHPENLRYIPSLVNIRRKNKLTLEEVALFTPKQIEIFHQASKKPHKYTTWLKKSARQSKSEQLSLNFLLVDSSFSYGTCKLKKEL